MTHAFHPDADLTHFTALANAFSAGYGDRLDGFAVSKTRLGDQAGAYAAGYAAASVDLEVFGKPGFGDAFKAWLTLNADRAEAPAMSAPASRATALASLSIGDSITIPKSAYKPQEVLTVEAETGHRFMMQPGSTRVQIKRWA